MRTREHAIKLSSKNEQALMHYLECKATNSFPDDPIVKRNAAYIAPIVNAAEAMPMISVLRDKGKNDG